jgi:SAM-dependent methyltransferase
MMSAPVSPARACSICGGSDFRDQPVLWPELIAAWELNPGEVAAINRQQGRQCTGCGANLRSQALAAAILAEYEFAGLFQEFVGTPQAQTLRVLEINRAGSLTPWLAQLAWHQLVEYPAVDMQRLPFPDGHFDLVVHSDTLEHVPDPLAGLCECRRVLRPAGRCVFTVPMIVGRLTRSCVGRPPSYHGGPENPADYRVHTEFGADAWLWPLRAGFSSCAIHHWDDPAAFAFAARTPQPPHAATLARAPGDTEQPASTVPSFPAAAPRLFRERVRLRLHQLALARTWAADRDVLHVHYGPSVGAEAIAAVARTFQDIDCRPDPHLSLPAASVDVAVCLGVLEHLVEPQRFVAELRRLLRAEGLLVVSTEVPGASERYIAGSAPPHPLSREQFLALLQQEFAQVAWGTQTLWNGSLLLLECPPGDPREFHSTSVDGPKWQEHVGVPYPQAWCAFATNAARLPPVPWGLCGYVQDVSPHKQEIDALRSRLDSVLNSRSWKLTAPLRWLTQRLQNR